MESKFIFRTRPSLSPYFKGDEMNFDEMIECVGDSMVKPDAFYLLPAILETLKAMEKLPRASGSERRRLASGLGRLVLEDYSFSESELGGKLLEFHDQYLVDSY